MSAPRSVLLVEDDHGLRYALEKVLNLEGFQVLATSSPFEALDLLEGPQPIDIMLADIMLGQRAPNGVTLALMARTRRVGLPVVFITAFEECVAFAKDHGPVMMKPVEGHDLAETIRREMARSAGDR